MRLETNIYLPSVEVKGDTVVVRDGVADTTVVLKMISRRHVGDLLAGLARGLAEEQKEEIA